MTDFKAKMHQIRFHGALPQTPLGGAYSARGRERGWAGEEEGKGEGEGGEAEGREREGPKLLLNQGPSEPCYATARVSSRDVSRHIFSYTSLSWLSLDAFMSCLDSSLVAPCLALALSHDCLGVSSLNACFAHA